MWGVEFLPGTKNALICGTAVFVIRLAGKPAKKHILSFGPNGMVLDHNEICRKVTPKEVEAILPKKEDYGHTWTWGDFLLAMTFWGEGNQARRK